MVILLTSAQYQMIIRQNSIAIYSDQFATSVYVGQFANNFVDPTAQRNSRMISLRVICAEKK
jgi:hypothetical protein